MKTRFLALAALVLGLASCQTEPEGLDVNVGGEQDVTIAVALPEAETRAAGTDSAKGGVANVDMSKYDLRYILEVYDEAGNLAKERLVEYEDNAQSTSFNLRLIPGRNYKFVVWADFVPEVAVERDPATNYDYHYNTANGLRAVEVNTTSWDVIDESRDAYTAVELIEDFSASTNIDITLTRPFAKLRVVTNDIEEMISIRPAEVKVNYFQTTFYNKFDAFTAKASGEYTCPELTATLWNKTEGDVDVYSGGLDAEDGVQTLFADYFFGAVNDRVMFTMDVKDNGDKNLPKVTFNTNIPVQRNMLTTVYGPVLTDSNNITVTINDAFENGTNWNPGDDKYDVEIWDGKTLTAPKYNATDDVYEISTGSQLAYFAAAINGTLPSTLTRAEAVDYNAETMVLTGNINLDFNEWTPIGNKDNKFQGTFDGQGHKIANLLITGNNSYVGLFGFTTNGEIKNLVVENAKVSGYLGVGVVAGSPYTSKFNDITVQGHVEVNGMAYVGGVGGRNAYASWNNVTVNVDETSYVNANSVEDGVAYRTYVGGVCGFNGEGGHSFTNITSNIDVKGSTIDVGGLFGIAHYGNKFENCSCSGDVEIYAAEEAQEAQEIGGIAGVWNNGGADVVFTNCTFTGTLKTNIPVDFYYGGLIGKPYSATGKGKLIIDGCEMVANGVGLKDGEYYIQSVAGLKWLAEQVNGGNNFSKKVVKLAADLDLNNEEWTPIGNSTCSFQGTFDGQNKKISNLVITGNKSDVGLFGRTDNGEIKNLVVENAKVSGYLNVAVVAGTPYTSKYNNITVKGHVEVNGMAYVGGVGGKNAYANWNNITVNVDETSYVDANSVEDGLAYRTYVGGVCGFNGEGSHSFTNITSNIDVKGSSIDVGGLFGIAHYGNNFDNCSCSGNVEIYAAEDAVDAQEIGGIAGVWHNENDKTVTMTNCTFTGKLKTNIADVDFYYGGLVGKPYSETGTGILWLNGNKCLANGIIEDENGNLVVNSLDSLEEALTTAGAAGAGDTTIVFAENTNINMTNAEWTPIKVDGYHGADIVTIEGNGAVITGLKAPLFAGGFAGGSGIVIKDLTIKDSDIVSANTLGSGAFIESVDSMAKIELTNCHLLDSTVTGGAGSRTGGLIGWTAGYNNVNDGPVKTYVTIDNCSVIGCTIQCDGSVGGINGHAGNNAWTYTTIKNCTIKNNNLNSTDDGEWRTGVVVGTANVGEVTISNITESGNTLTQTGKTAPEGYLRNYYGRAVLGTTGKLTIEGNEYVAEGLFEDAEGNAVVGNQTALVAALDNGATTVYLSKGTFIVPDSAQGKTVTFIGAGDPEDTVIATQDDGSYEGCDYSLDGSTVVFENISINTDSSTYTGYARCKGTYKNCIINGTYTLYDNSVFEDCTFNVSGDVYNIWTWGAPTATFTRCTFNCDGKAMLLYGTANTKLTMNNCVFNDKGGLADLKAAIEIGNDYNKSYELIVNNATVNGFEINDKGINTGTTLWANKNSMGQDKLNVVVDGVDVY